MNIWLEVRNQQQGPTFRKLQLEAFFPFAYILSRYLTGKYVSERRICFLHYALFSSQCHYMTLK